MSSGSFGGGKMGTDSLSSAGIIGALSVFDLFAMAGMAVSCRKNIIPTFSTKLSLTQLPVVAFLHDVFPRAWA